MQETMLIFRAVLFLLLAIALWFAGTVFHLSLWWTLGVPGIPPVLPLANLALFPLCIWLSWHLTLHPRGLACVRCQGKRPSPSKPEPVAFSR